MKGYTNGYSMYERIYGSPRAPYVYFLERPGTGLAEVLELRFHYSHLGDLFT